LRHFPVFAMPGSGEYRLQPVMLSDVGEIVAEAATSTADMTVDAAGPDILTFNDFVAAISLAIGRKRPVLHLPPGLSLLLLAAVGRAVREVILSKEELQGLITERLVSTEAPRGSASVLQWLAQNGRDLGISYSSEFERHVRKSR